MWWLVLLSTLSLVAAPVGALSVQANLQKALSSHQAGDIAEAAVFYEKVVNELGVQSTPTVVLSNMGAAFLALDKPDRAEQAWRDAIANDPSHAESRLNLAVSLQSEDRLSEARLDEAEGHARAVSKTSRRLFTLCYPILRSAWIGTGPQARLRKGLACSREHSASAG